MERTIGLINILISLVNLILLPLFWFISGIGPSTFYMLTGLYICSLALFLAGFKILNKQPTGWLVSIGLLTIYTLLSVYELFHLVQTGQMRYFELALIMIIPQPLFIPGMNLIPTVSLLAVESYYYFKLPKKKLKKS